MTQSKYVNLPDESNVDHNIDFLLEEILEIAVEKGFTIYKLGVIENDIIYLIERKVNPEFPNLLIAAGFHGEEIAGPWGILFFLEQLDQKMIDNINLSIIPLLNTTGFRNGSRNNKWDENPNRCFLYPELNQIDPSKEGKILLDNIDMLIEKSRDGFITLHEDIDREKFNIYTYEKESKPSEFSYVLRNTMERYFECLPDENDPEIGDMKDGIIFNHCDGSFEDFLFQKGILRSVCIETPGHHDLIKRIISIVDIINSFIKFSLGEKI
jgi:hypothetical protein